MYYIQNIANNIIFIVNSAGLHDSYYMDELPQWVIDFNAPSNISNYVKTWNTLYDINLYQESGPDNSNYEKGFNGKAAPVFPYDLNVLKGFNQGFDIIKISPFGNTMITDFAFSAIEAERIGLVNRCTVDSGLLRSAAEMATVFASKPPNAIRAARTALVRASDRGYRDDIAKAVDDFCTTATSVSTQKRLRSFLENRQSR
mgnify:CR=1 FL=1